jgi:hypothetical protein
MRLQATGVGNLGERSNMLACIFSSLCRGIIVISLLGLGFLMAGCAGSQEPVTGSFVGETSDPVMSVAIVAAEPAQGEESREVRALIYGDRENPINEWFVGAATGNDLDLTSEGGAQFKGELTSEGTAGTITLPDGTSVPFDTVPATGVAGLYNVTISPDGLADGASEDGAQLEGQLASQPESEVPGRPGEGSAPVFPLTGTITPTNDQPQDFEVSFLMAPVREPDEALTARFVVSDDGTIRGGAKKGSGSQFTCPMID